MNHTIKVLIAQEEAALKALRAAGYVDPTTEKGSLGTLFPEVNGQRYRRFITGFGEVMFDNLDPGNVRADDFDENHCKTVIIPWLQKDGAIQCPIFTTPRPGITIEEIDSGHHRGWSSNTLWPDRPIPRCTLSANIYECDLHGNVTNPTPVDTSIHNYMAIVSRMLSNPTARHKDYKMEDRAQQIHSLLKEDPTLRGLVPNGIILVDCDAHRDLWDDIMDVYVPDQFRGQAQRTTVFRKFLKATDDKVKPVVEADITEILVKRGLDTGIPTTGRSKKRKAFLKHYDEPTNCLIASFDTNGRNIQHKLEALFREAYWRGELDHYPAGLSIGVVLKIDNPSTSLVELSKERDAATNVLREVNQRFVQSGIRIGNKQVLVKWVQFPKQLKKNSNDTGRFKKLHKPTDVLFGETGTITKGTKETGTQQPLSFGLGTDVVH